MLVQDVYLFSSYFWDRLWRNFDHACDVTSSILVKWLISKKFDNFIILLLYAAKCQEKAEMACSYMHERSLDNQQEVLGEM